MVKKLLKNTRGNALIEFVLVLPLLLTLVLGIIDWGWYFTVREVAINATRQGARVGSASPGTAAADARTAVTNYLTNALGASFSRVPTVAPSTCNAAGYQCVAVSLTAYPTVPSRPTSSITGLQAWTRVPVTLTVQSEMRLEIQP
jgi:Flp pilus assembly protein TadG